MQVLHDDHNHAVDGIAQLESNIQGLLESLLELGMCTSDVQPTALEAGTSDAVAAVNGMNGQHAGYPAPGGLVGRKVQDTVEAMEAVFAAPARHPETMSLLIPNDVVDYVDQGRNPELYTRENIERVAAENQYTNGILDAVGSYRDLLAQEMKEAFPALCEAIDALGIPPPAASLSIANTSTE